MAQIIKYVSGGVVNTDKAFENTDNYISAQSAYDTLTKVINIDQLNQFLNDNVNKNRIFNIQEGWEILNSIKQLEERRDLHIPRTELDKIIRRYNKFKASGGRRSQQEIEGRQFDLGDLGRSIANYGSNVANAVSKSLENFTGVLDTSNPFSTSESRGVFIKPAENYSDNKIEEKVDNSKNTNPVDVEKFLKDPLGLNSYITNSSKSTPDTPSKSTPDTPSKSTPDTPSKSTQSTSSHEAIFKPVTSRIENTQEEILNNSENPEEEELETVDFDLLSDDDKNFDLQSLNPKTPKSKYSLPLTPIVSTISMLNRKRTNDRVFNKLNKGLKPTIIDTPRDINYTIQGNEGVRNQYRKAAADTRNLLITPQSSDMNTNLAYSLAVNKQANDYALQGDLANEQALQQSREKAFQVQTENQRRREQVAAQNQQSITNTKNYKVQLDAQRVSKNADNWNTYLHDLVAQIKHRSDEVNLAKRTAEHERLQLYGLNLNNRKEYLNKLLTSGNYTEGDKIIINNQIKEIDGLIESLKKSTINNKYSTNPIW